MYKKLKMVCIMFLFIYFGLHYTLLCDIKTLTYQTIRFTFRCVRLILYIHLVNIALYKLG